MATRVHRPDSSRPYRWQAFCEAHQNGINSSKPTCIKWAEEHVKDNHPGEEVIYE